MIARFARLAPTAASLALLAPLTATAQAQGIPLEEVFAPVQDVHVWTWADFDAELDPLTVPHDLGGYYRISANTRGIRFWGFKDGADPALDVPEMHQSRLDLELVVPKAWMESPVPPAFTPLLHVAKVADPGDIGEQLESEGYEQKLAMAISLAKKGYVATVLWSEDDDFDGAEDDPEDPAPHKVYFDGPGQNALQRKGFAWIILRIGNGAPITAEALRFDFRFGYAQGAILAKTFFRRYLEERHGSPSGYVAWLAGIDTVHHGGSKSGGGAVTAAGYDPDCVGVRIAGYGGYDQEETGFMPRYETDWCEPSYGSTGPKLHEGEHYWRDFAVWGWANRDVHPSYYDTYIVERDPERYEDALLLDIVGTHDWINPLGCSTGFWERHDGLDANGAIDLGEPRWDYRIVKRVNRNHGAPFVVSVPGPPYNEAAMGDLALWHALRHLSAEPGIALPRLDLAWVDTSDPALWRARVRVSNPDARTEVFRVHVALSDDRDFRRCGEGIVHREGAPPGDDDHGCFDRPHDFNDDNDPGAMYMHPSEDLFVPCAISSVSTVQGEFRELEFEPPAAVLAEFSAEPGAPHPMVATIVELELPDGNPASVKNDLYLHTEVAFTEVLPPDCSLAGD